MACRQRKLNAGFSTLFIVMILSAVLLLLLTAAESASGFAAKSISTDICKNAGLSVLSEFQPKLWSRYGLYMLRGYEKDLVNLLDHYISSSCPSKAFIKLKSSDISVDTGPYCGLNSEYLKKQVVTIGTMYAAKNLLSETDLFKMYKESEDASDKDDYLSVELPEIDEEDEEAADQAASLNSMYEESVKPDKFNPKEGARLDRSLILTLPSYLLKGESYFSLDSDNFFTNEYIVNIFSNYVNNCENVYFTGEAEYVLCGKPSDSENASDVNSQLFWLRFGLNLVDIYSDPSQLSELTAIAAASFNLLPAPLVVFMLASIRAAGMAKTEVKTIMSGGFVEFIKGKTSNFGNYKDYLRILLLSLDEETKLERIMDIIQLDMTQKEGADFSFSDYAYGFDMTAVIEKTVNFPSFIGIKKRFGTITQTHVYKE